MERHSSRSAAARRSRSPSRRALPRGFYDVRLRGGRDRFFANERHLRSLDELLDALSGGEHATDLVATGLGRGVTTTADLMVTAKGAFTVQVVRWSDPHGHVEGRASARPSVRLLASGDAPLH